MNCADLSTQSEENTSLSKVLETIEDTWFAPDLLSELPVEWARGRLVLPLRIDGLACVAMVDPDDIKTIDDLALVTGLDLEPVGAAEAVLRQAIERCYAARSASPADFMEQIGEVDDSVNVSGTTSEDLLRSAQETPVTQLVNLILLEAVRRDASDIHFEPSDGRLRVRYRIDGVLYEQSSPPGNMVNALISRLKVMARLDLAERRLPQDGVAQVRVGERGIDVRVSTVPVGDGERVVLRLLHRESVLRPLSSLGMSEGLLDDFSRQFTKSSGLIIVSGPTGSGKTTTLYAALRSLDSSRQNIMTIEDPVEYQLPSIAQIQVRPRIELGFARGLRHILRQDPDVVLVGETRDQETAEIAVRAALTGHLVLTTLHTNDAPGAVIRMLDLGIEPFLLAASLSGVLAQRLVRRLCPQCKQAGTADPSQIALFPQSSGLPGNVWLANGCNQCLEGYHGRLGVFELMNFSPAARELLRSDGLTHSAIHKQACVDGMHPLLEDGIAKVAAGETTIDELLSRVLL